MVYEFFSGSYGKVGEEGIVKFRMDTDAGTLKKLYANTEILNPSYLAFNSDKTILYTVQEEVPVGKIHAFKVGEEELAHLAELSTGGADPCHISMDRGERVMFADNYTSGSLAVFRMENGLPAEMSDFIQHKGHGVNPVRQEGPHIHYTKEHNGQAFVDDLGLDLVFIYDINFETGKFTDTGRRLVFEPGLGPRHIEFHRRNPDIVYVVCELGNRVVVFEKKDGEYLEKQSVSTLPEGFDGKSTAAAIKMQDNLLFATNRGDDSIAVYRVGDEGELTLTDIVKTGGKTPRDFTLFGDYCVIANQDSDLITVLKVDWEKGNLSDTGMRAETIRPSCIRKY